MTSNSHEPFRLNNVFVHSIKIILFSALDKLESPDMYVFNGRWRISELSKFFSKLILLGRFPQAWEFANVTPVFKKGVKQLLNNYWPISLLSRLGKTMERSVHKYVYSCCIKHHIFTASQSGFIQGDSTMYQLLQLYDTFCKAVDNGKEVELFFFFFEYYKSGLA